MQGGGVTLPHPIIFLDVDGVLNSWWLLEESKNLRGMAAFHVALLADVLRKTEARIVVSSTWRFEVGDDGSTRPGTRFHDELAEKGENGALVLSRIVGRTKDLWDWVAGKSIRGNEIRRWIEDHGTPWAFVVVDDDFVDVSPLVRTSMNRGLTRAKADEMILALARESAA